MQQRIRITRSSLCTVLYLGCAGTGNQGGVGLLGWLQPVDYRTVGSSSSSTSQPSDALSQDNNDAAGNGSNLRSQAPSESQLLGAPQDSGTLQDARSGDSKSTTGADSGIGNGLGPISPALREGPTGDCAEPTRVNVSKSLAESADIVVTGLVVAAGKGNIICAPNNSTLPSLASYAASKNVSIDSLSGPDLLVEYKPAAANSSQGGNDGAILLVAVQCVHKGALACRRNSLDAKSGISSCLVAVKVPAQQMPSKGDNKTLAPCSVTPGFRCVSAAMQL